MSRHIADLRDRTGEISRICHESGQPVFVTQDGEGDLVVMSRDAYERVLAKLELYGFLDEAEEDVRSGDQGISVETMRERLRA